MRFHDAPGVDELLSAGHRCLARGDADSAIRHFNALLKIAPGSAGAQLGLYKAFMAKGDAGDRQFYVLAMEAARHSGQGAGRSARNNEPPAPQVPGAMSSGPGTDCGECRPDPAGASAGAGGALDADAADRLINAGFRAGRLDELAMEFRVRADNDPAFSALLKKIYAISALATENAPRSSGYKPSLFIRVFFDCLLLPASCAAIVASVAIPRARPAFAFGVFLFVCYAVYRITLSLLRRYR